MAGKKRTEEKARYRHLSELGGLEMLQARYVRQRFPRHVHETYCIGVIEDGAQRFYRSGGGACGSQGRHHSRQCR